MISHSENYGMVEQADSNGGRLPTVGNMSESLIQIIWRSRWIILIATVVALAAAFIYLSKATPIYTSTSRIYVEQSGPKIITDMEEGVMTRAKNYLYTQAELLKSTPIVSATLDIQGIRQLKTFAHVDNQIAYLKNSLNVSIGKKDDIINVSFDSPWPSEAAQLVNAVVDSYITYHATRKRSTSAEVLKILQKEKNERGKELTEKLKAMMDFKKENLALAFDNQRGNIILDRLERLSTVLTEAQLATIEAKSIYESTKEMVSNPAMLKQFIDAQRAKGVYVSMGGEGAQLKSKLDELERQRADRLRLITASHPSVIAIDTEISKIKQEIDNFDAEFAQAQLVITQQQHLAAQEKERQIAKYFEDQRQQTLTFNEQIAQYTILQSDWEQTKKLCDILDERIKELNVTEDVGALNISILEVARPETTPTEPQKARIMAIALVLGLMLGGGLALIRDWMDQRMRSSEEISAILGMPVLGLVPSMSRKDSIATRGKKVHLDSDSRVAEAYRTIRTAVFFGAPKDETKTILVTSPGALDGKTTLVSNLAIAMAQAGQKTLILDADFRRPMQHKIFGINHDDKGLTSVLAGMSTLKETIQPTEVKGLALLPCGPDVPNPSEILNSEAFSKTLQYLSEKYDRVIIDSPPVMSVTDAQILGAICDITLLVLRAEKSTRKISKQACEGLLSVGARILGAVVNDVMRKNGRYGYYSGYGGYYYYYDHYGRRKKKKTGERKPGPVTEDIRIGVRSND